MNEAIYKAGLEDTAVFELKPKRSLKNTLKDCLGHPVLYYPAQAANKAHSIDEMYKEIKEDKDAIRDVTKLRLENGGGLIIIEYHKRPKKVYIFKSFANATKYYNYFRNIFDTNSFYHTFSAIGYTKRILKG